MNNSGLFMFLLSMVSVSEALCRSLSSEQDTDFSVLTEDR